MRVFGYKGVRLRRGSDTEVRIRDVQIQRVRIRCFESHFQCILYSLNEVKNISHGLLIPFVINKRERERERERESE